MNRIGYARAQDVASAIASVAGNTDAAFLAGGTTLVDLMKIDVERPRVLIDVNKLPLGDIAVGKDGGLKIGAMVRNTDLAEHPAVRQHFPVLSQALLAGASGQLRNMATVGGNLMQRTRCTYFRDVSMACNKRKPGSGCAAMEGFNRGHAVLGTSEHCIATHPSDMSVALVALNAVVRTAGPDGERRIPIGEFHRLPGDTPQIETALRHGELIVEVELPAQVVAANSHYLKVRDRSSYEFALASAAVALHVENGTIGDARLALGGLGTKPWRAIAGERALIGKKPSLETFKDAAAAALQGAQPHKYNGYKVELGQRTIVRALTEVARIA
jgi:xanthine dehydrogenase YagS FAD-binding subunit